MTHTQHSRGIGNNEYKQHCLVIDHTDWSRNEKRHIKSQLKKFLDQGKPFPYKSFPPSYRWNFCSARLRDCEFSNWDGWEFRSDWAMTFRWGQELKCEVHKWDGGPTRHLVVLGEQGIGDEIMFMSALPDLQVRVGTKNIEFQTYPRLKPIVERSLGVRCTDRKPLTEVREGEFVAALGDLFPWYRRDKSHFPRKPFLKPNDKLVNKWKRELAKLGDRPKVGVAWKSRHGSLNPKDIMNEDAVYVNLQYGPTTTITSLWDPPTSPLESLEEHFALVSAVDKVVTVTQTVAHVAGSIGKECHAIIPPKNGEVDWYLWYHLAGQREGVKSWPHLVYGSVTVYETIEDFRGR